MSIKRMSLALLGLALSSHTAAAPLYSRNFAPVTGLFGFPALRSAAALPGGEFSAGLYGTVANNYSVDVEGDEAVNFDGETQRGAFRAALGLGAGWDLELEVPWLRHEGGFMDQYIEDWHDLWGLPDGNRDEAPRDLIDFSYAGPDTRFAMRDDVSGWGDPQLALVKNLWLGEGAAVSARAGVKFSVGDDDELLGSGSEDYYLSLNFSGAQQSDLPLTWHGQLGYLRAGDADVLGDIQEQDLWFAALGVEWRTWQSVHLKLQVDGNAAVADSKLEQLGDPAVQLTAGLSWLFAPGWEAEFSFSEDIAVDTAPDFTWQLGLRYRPRGD